MKYRVLMSTLTSFIVVKSSPGLPWLAWATKATNNIKDEDLEFGETPEEVKMFSAELQRLFFDRTSGTAWDIANAGGEGREDIVNFLVRDRRVTESGPIDGGGRFARPLG